MKINTHLEAVRTDSGYEALQGAIYELIGGYRNDAGVVTAVGTPTSVILSEDDTDMNVMFNINGTDVEIKVKGVTGKDFKWAGETETREINV